MTAPSNSLTHRALFWLSRSSFAPSPARTHTRRERPTQHSDFLQLFSNPPFRVRQQRQTYLRDSCAGRGARRQQPLTKEMNFSACGRTPTRVCVHAAVATEFTREPGGLDSVVVSEDAQVQTRTRRRIMETRFVDLCNY